MKLSSFIRTYYLYNFFFDFVFAYAIYNAFFAMQGLSVGQISCLLAWWSGCVVVFELPSGALADHWNRRSMLILAPFFKALCFLVWIFAQGNIWLYGLGFAFWALGSSFRSGTKEALLYDTLIEADKTSLHAKILGREKFFFKISLALAVILGGIIASINTRLVFMLSTGIMLITSIIGMFFREKNHHGIHTKNEKSGYYSHFNTMLCTLRSSIQFRRLIIYSSFMILLFGVLEEYDQLYYQYVGLPIALFGFIMFCGSLLESLGSIIAHQFKGRPWVLWVLPAGSAICLLIVSFFHTIPSIIALLGAYFLIAPISILFDDHFQKTITSKSRATITSARTFVNEIVAIILYGILGVLSDVFTFPSIYFLCAVIITLATIWSVKMRRKGQQFL